MGSLAGYYTSFWYDQGRSDHLVRCVGKKKMEKLERKPRIDYIHNIVPNLSYCCVITIDLSSTDNFIISPDKYVHMSMYVVVARRSSILDLDFILQTNRIGCSVVISRFQSCIIYHAHVHVVHTY